MPVRILLAILLAACVQPCLCEPAAASSDATAKAEARPQKLPAGVVEREGQFFCAKDGAEMIYVAPGSFLMGTKTQKENPVARVYLDAYFIDRFETTNAQYRKFVEETGHPAPRFVQRGRTSETWNDLRLSKPTQPVVGVSWQDAADYCKWAGKLLPTQAQWEKAARGTDGRKYPWGAAHPNDGQQFRANYAQIGRPGAPQQTDGYACSAPVGTFGPDRSAYGLADMAGNVSEWCRDWFSIPDPRNRNTTNPEGPDKGQAKIIRGGSWLSSLQFGDPLRCTEVQFQNPKLAAPSLGLRGVIPLEAESGDE